MAKNKQDGWVKFTLRLSPELHRRLAETAGAKSLNAEIIGLIEAGLSGREPHTANRFETSGKCAHVVLLLSTAQQISNGLSDIALWCHGFNAALSPDDHARRPWGTEAITDINLRLKAAIKEPF